MEYSKNTIVFDLLVKPIRRLIEQRGFSSPTDPQEKMMPKILEGKNVLLISPTATGKTEAAVLQRVPANWVISHNRQPRKRRTVLGREWSHCRNC